MEGCGVLIQADQCPQAVEGCVCVCVYAPALCVCVCVSLPLTDELKRATESD